jgi:hypothetical protein
MAVNISEIVCIFCVENIIHVMSVGLDNVSELWPPTGLLFIPQIINGQGEPRWNDIDRVKWKNSEKNLSQCTLSTTNPMWTNWATDPGPCRERLAANHMIHCMEYGILTCILRHLNS